MIQYTKYKRPEKVYEKTGGKVLVETSGYVTVKQRIEAMINAGLQLKISRGQYDFNEGEEIDEGFNDPTRNTDFDLVDADNTLRGIDERVQTRKKMEEQDRRDRQEEENRKKSGEGDGLQGNDVSELDGKVGEGT